MGHGPKPSVVHEGDVALFDAVAFALTAPDVPRALDAALHEILRGLELAAGWVWLVDPATTRFYLAAARDLPPYLAEPVQMTGDPCWCMESFVDGDFDSKNVDIIACSRLRRAQRDGRDDRTRGLRSHASVALRFGERRLGIMNVSPPAGRTLHDRELRLLAAIGAQMGLAVERGRLAEEGASAARSGERTRLAREIHDTLAQDLTAIALQLESALRELAESSDAARRVRTALDVARASLAQARASVISLRADPLAGRSLESALAALTRRLTSETGTLVAFHAAGAPALTYEAEAELFRIASEALLNARTHARATRIDVELDARDGGASLRVRDDGVGFDPARRDADAYGLIGMEERAHVIGGRFRIETSPGRGTLIEIAVPARA